MKINTKRPNTPLPDLPFPNLQHYHFPSVSSTMYLADLVLHNNPILHTLPNLFQRCFAVSATKQSDGIGTKGRTWESPQGNCYLTLTVPKELIIFKRKILSLKLSSIIAKSVMKYLPDVKVTTQWPNDVLIGNKKISGILIKEENDYLLFGIGVNVKQAPDIKQGRTATCVFEYSKNETDGCQESEELAKTIAKEIYKYLEDIQSLKKDTIEQEVLEEWKKMTEFGKEYKIRNDDNSTETTEKSYITLGVEKDGKLRVKNKDGKEEILESFVFME